MNETKQYIRKWKHASIECKECGYHGSTDTTRSFDGLGKHGVVKYVCPKCLSPNIKYISKEIGMWR